MEELYGTYLGYMTEGLVLAVASNPADKAEDAPTKLRIRPVNIRGEVRFQVTQTVGTKELHENLDAPAAAELLCRMTAGEPAGSEYSAATAPVGSGYTAATAPAGSEYTSAPDKTGAVNKTSATQQFRQIEIQDNASSLLVMVSKKGKRTVKQRRLSKPTVCGTDTACENGTSAANQDRAETAAGVQSHNRTRSYLLPEGEPVPFLVELGVMARSGQVVKARYDKFRQINRYLEFVEDILPSLPSGREISIIDFGCGKSYLTFALYYYLHEKRGLDVRITGLDLKRDVIENCNLLAKKFKYDKLNFLHGDIADYTGTDSVDMVITLHACDTATDYALFKAITWHARVIFCVPCCQHELNRLMKDERQKSVFRYGLIKERMAALYTDAFRADMLEEQGYKTQILEFIDMEHTPKNILIRAVRQPQRMLPKGMQETAGAGYAELMKELGVTPTLYRLLHDQYKDT